MKKKANSKDTIPRALRDSWDWKHAVYRETKAMDTACALDRIHADADAIRETYGLRMASPPSATAMVAEESPKYGSEK
ncbi:MAG: hypothetical protein ABFR33_09665 [Verrucomicrobiota bacterium]